MEDLEKQEAFENILNEEESTLLVKENGDPVLGKCFAESCSLTGGDCPPVTCCETYASSDECPPVLCASDECPPVLCAKDFVCLCDGSGTDCDICPDTCSCDVTDASTDTYTWMLVWAASVSGSVKNGTLNQPIAGAYQLLDASVTPNSGSVSAYLSSTFIQTFNPFLYYQTYSIPSYGVSYYWKSGVTTNAMSPFVSPWSSVTATASIHKGGHKPQFNRNIRIVGNCGLTRAWTKRPPNYYFGSPNIIVSNGWAKKFRLPQGHYSFNIYTDNNGYAATGAEIGIFGGPGTSALTGIFRVGSYGTVQLITSATVMPVASLRNTVTVQRPGSDAVSNNFYVYSGVSIYMYLVENNDKSHITRFRDIMDFDASEVRGYDYTDYGISSNLDLNRAIRYLDDSDIYFMDYEFEDAHDRSLSRHLTVPIFYYSNSYLTPSYFRNDETGTNIYGSMSKKAQYPLSTGDIMLRGYVMYIRNAPVGFVALSGVEVRIAGVVKATTDSNGYYEIPSGGTDPNSVTFSKSGYETLTYTYASQVPSIVQMTVQTTCVYDS